MNNLMGVETDAFGNIFAVSSHDDLDGSGTGHKVFLFFREIDLYYNFCIRVLLF